LADSSLAEFVERASTPVALVRTPDVERLISVVEEAGGELEPEANGAWRLSGMVAAEIGESALRAGVALHELTPLRSSLEDVYSELVSDTVAYRAREVGS
jgi:ABC-2 type transport system ATP-binding protein